MTKSFKCSHGGLACNAEITGESTEEVLGKAVNHARDEHGVDLTSSNTLARYAESLIEDTDAEQPQQAAERS